MTALVAIILLKVSLLNKFYLLIEIFSKYHIIAKPFFVSEAHAVPSISTDQWIRRNDNLEYLKLI
jgi:hypothetical protein